MHHDVSRFCKTAINEKLRPLMTDIKKDDFAWTTPIAVRWGDMDSMGHVNNAMFFTYDEQTRIDYFASLMKNDPKFWKDYGLILARIECDFLAQVHAPALLEARFRITEFGRTSMKTQAGMFLGDKLVAVTRGVLVWFDYKQGKALPIPDDVKSGIRAFERTPVSG